MQERNLIRRTYKRRRLPRQSCEGSGCSSGDNRANPLEEADRPRTLIGLVFYNKARRGRRQSLAWRRRNAVHPARKAANCRAKQCSIPTKFQAKICGIMALFSAERQASGQSKKRRAWADAALRLGALDTRDSSLRRAGGQLPGLRQGAATRQKRGP